MACCVSGLCLNWWVSVVFLELWVCCYSGLVGCGSGSGGGGRFPGW